MATTRPSSVFSLPSSILPFAALALLLMSASIARAAAAATSWTMMNPTGREYADELVRIKVDVPEGIAEGRWVVKEDGREVAYQVEEIEGERCIWVATDLAPGRTHTYTVEPGRPSKMKPRVQVREWQGAITMDNDLMAIRLPAAARRGEVPSPVTSVALPDGRWAGGGRWHAERELAGFRATVVGDGTLFGKVRLRYDFEGKGGLFGEEPAFAQVDVSLEPGRRHAVVEESFAMGRREWWEFDCAGGWAARSAVVQPHFGGFQRPTLNDPEGRPYPFPPRTLAVGQTRMGDTLLNLVPRWSQAYDDGWFFMATDATMGVGAVACRAGKWLWPYDGMIEVKVRESADYAGLRCPTWRGRRYWYLVAGPKETWEEPAARDEYVLRHACEGLDKLHREYILDWPGLAPTEGAQLTPEEAAAWSSGAGRFSRRNRPFPGWGPGGAHWGGSEHPVTLLTRVQGRFDPDTYGTHWLCYSPENANFFSSWVGGMLGGVEKLKEHPQFDAVRRLARQKVLEELYFGVTMPGGAGQECFGYMARGSWRWHTEKCDEIGCDTREMWPMVRAAGEFIFKTSHPMPDGSRRSHPGGDTHPPGPDVFEAAESVGAPADATALRTEEFPGYGVVFRNNAGTARETYFAFKSGPNRGHFHGDQLAFHYCAYGCPLIVDHHCSYGPRAGQEHMHNRVAFHTDSLPWANMDGYERLIAFKTADGAEVAMGEVESERLRITEKFPPEKWDWSLPQEPLTPNLRYRRTVVFLKGDEGVVRGGRPRLPDCFVIRDQFAGPALHATYCLHVYGETCERDGPRFDFDGASLFVATPREFEVSRHDWEHSNGGREVTKGLRLTVTRPEGEFVTVLVPRPRVLFPVARLTLKDALARQDRDRSGRTTTSLHDMELVLTWVDGRLLTDAPAMRSWGFDRKAGFSGVVAVAETAGGMDVTVKGTCRSGRDGAPFEFALSLRRKGDVLSGTYGGTFRGKEVEGAASGAFEREGASPVVRYGARDPVQVEPSEGGVRIGDAEVIFSGGIDDVDGTVYVSVTRGGRPLLTLTGRDVDMDRFQGEIGLFVPDAGYPFGVIPDWLIRQRHRRPDWYEDSWPPTRAGRAAPGR